MKSSFLYFTMAVFVIQLFSCNSKKIIAPDVLIHDSSENQNFYLAKSGTKLKNGKVQCDNYSTLQIEDSNIVIYGMNLHTILKEIGGFDFLKIMDHTLANTDFDLEVAADSVLNKKMVLQKILKVLNLNHDSAVVKKDGYILTYDSSKIIHNVERTISINGNDLSFKNAKLDVICSMLSEEYEMPILSDNDESIIEYLQVKTNDWNNVIEALADKNIKMTKDKVQIIEHQIY